MTTKNTESSGVDGWVILELMGHRRLAGHVSEVMGGGLAGFIRIDVPGEGDTVQATQFYAPGAIYCLTPTTEEAARAEAERYRPAPVQRLGLPAAIDVHADDDEDLDEGDDEEIDDIRNDTDDLEDGPVGGEGGE